MGFDGGEDRLLGVFIRIDDENLGIPAGAGEGDHHQEDRQDEAGDDGDHGEAGAADDADTDGPKEEDQIHGVLDGGAEADDAEGADHAEGDDDVALDGQDNGGGNDRQFHEGEAETPVVKGVFIHHSVHKIDIEGDQGGQAYAGEHGGDVQFVGGIAFEKGTLEQFFQGHGLFSSKINFLSFTYGPCGTGNTWRRRSREGYPSGESPSGGGGRPHPT